jgi:tryptophan-rich sensory protein
MSIISALLIAFAICVISAMLEGLFAGKGVKAFIANLRTPSYAPPFWVWIIIGVFYYIISFLISYQVLRHSGDSFLKAVSLALLLAMMGINAVWNYVFFRAHNLFLSFFAFIPYPLLAIGLFACLLQFEPLAAWMFLPYLAYLNYAAFICYKFWKLNENPG